MAKDEGAGREKLISVTIDGEDRQIVDGEYTMEQLVGLFGLTAGYVLSVRHGQGSLEPMEPGKAIKVHPNMKFISQAPDGNWS